MDAKNEQVILRGERKNTYRIKVPTAVRSLGAVLPPSPVVLLLTNDAGANTFRARKDKNNP